MRNEKIAKFFEEYKNKHISLDFSTYFETRITSFNLDSYTFTFNICLKNNGDPVKELNLEYDSDEEKFTIYSSRKYFVPSENTIEYDFLNEALASYIQNNFDAAYKNFSELDETIYQKQYIVNLNYFIDSLNRLNTKKQLQKYEGKLNIEFYFDTTGKVKTNIYTYISYLNQKSNRYTLEKLLRDVNNQNLLSGKKVPSLTLSFSLFNDSSQRVLDFLKSNIRYNSYYLEDNVISNFDTLFKILKDKIVYIDSIPYQVRLNELKPKIEITNDYDLKIDKIDGYTELFNSNIYYNKSTFNIDIVSLDPIYNNLYELVKNAPVTSIKEHKDQFKYTTFLNYQNNFRYSNKIKREFEFNALNIKGYFDFNSKQEITVKSEYFINDIKYKPEDLQNDALLVYNRYQEVLISLGFKDGIMTDQGDIWSFLNDDLSILRELCDIYLSDAIKSKKLSMFNPPKVYIQNDVSILKAFLGESEYTPEELYAILKAIKKKRKFILLKDNIINIDSQNAIEFNKVTSELNLLKSEDELSTKKEIPPYFAFKLNDSSLVDMQNEYVETLFNDFKNFKNLNLEPPLLNATLRPYQVDAFKWLNVCYKDNVGGILADDMGLGKTIEIISFLKGLNIDKPILIVSPTSLIFNWLNEYQKFTKDEEIVALYGQANDRKTKINSINPNKKVTYITSYESLRNDIGLYEDKEFDIAILDEAQFIKNIHALKTQSVKKINAKHKFVLTGTPIENSVIDLWSIFDFLMPGYLPNLSTFKEAYERDPNYSKTIKKLVAPFILRRVKDDVLKDLPEKYEVIMTCDMTKEQRKNYDAYKLLANDTLSSGGTVFNVLQYLTRLRQICISPSLFIEDYKGGSGKLNALIEILEDEINSGNRVLIFSQFVEALKIVENYLTQEEIKYFMITGQTKSQERVEICNEFNVNNRIKVGIISLKAGGTGLNLIGGNVVIHLDPWWNYAAEQQATDRAHRIGQTRNVKVIKLICEDSIEQRVVELQNHKKDIVKEIVSTDDSSITNLTREDIKFILESNN